MKIRSCKCLQCKNEFDWVVEYSETTQNLSGEKSVWCPKCGSKNLMLKIARSVQENLHVAKDIETRIEEQKEARNYWLAREDVEPIAVGKVVAYIDGEITGLRTALEIMGK